MRPLSDAVAITGLGVVSPLGDAGATWRGLRDGRRAVRGLRFEVPCGTMEVCGASVGQASGLSPRAREVGVPASSRNRPGWKPGLRTHAGIERYGSDRLLGWSLAATDAALADAGLDLAAVEPQRVGVVVGTSKGVPERWADAAFPFFPDRTPDTAAVAVARHLGVAGPVLCPVAACSTGLVAVLRGAELIRRGECDVVLAGAADASLHPLVLASFKRMGVLAGGAADGSARGAAGFNPAARGAVCRPFDRDRCGFAVGEGAAVFVLQRGPVRRRYAALAGGCVAGDAAGLTAVDPEGRTAAHALSTAIGRAGLTAGDVTLLGLHGTGTVPNDPAECRAVRSALGPAADDAAAFGIKGAVGHLLGAAGAVELAAVLLGLRDGVAPPTVNLRDRDPACDLPLVDAVRPVRPGAAAKLSLGFGGTIAAAVLVP